MDITYPSDETPVESVQQIGGNLVSALLVLLMEIRIKQDYQLLPINEWFASDIRRDAKAEGLLARESGMKSLMNRWSWVAIGGEEMRVGEDKEAVLCFQQTLRCRDVVGMGREKLGLFFGLPCNGGDGNNSGGGGGGFPWI